MTPLICQQVDMLINNAHDTAEFSPNHESSELTSSLPHEEDLSIIHQEIRAIAAETAEDVIINVLHHLNLLLHKFKSIEHTYTSQSIQSIQSIQTLSSTSMTLSYTCTESIKSKNIDYFDLKLYAEFTISDSENSSTIYDVFLFVN